MRRRMSCPATAGVTGRNRRPWPIICSSAGRANSSKLTWEETGLPGRPKIGTPWSIPKASGFAGRMAICHHSISAMRRRTFFTMS